MNVKNATNGRRDESIVKRLMALTFADRRAKVNEDASIKEIKEIYPFLFSKDKLGCLNQSVGKEILKEVENANPVRLEGEDEESR